MSITAGEIAEATGLSCGQGSPDLWGEVRGMKVHIEWSRYTNSAYIDIYAKKGSTPISAPLGTWLRAHEGFSPPRALPGKGTGMRMMLKLGPEDTAGIFAAELDSLMKMLSDNGCIPICSGCSSEGMGYSFYRAAGNVEYLCPDCARSATVRAEQKPSPSGRVKGWLITLICFLPGAAAVFAGELWLMKQNAGLGLALPVAAAGILLNIYLYKKAGIRPGWLTAAVCVVICCLGAAAGLVVRYSGYMADHNREYKDWYHQALDYSRAVQLGMDPEDALVYIEPKWQEEISALLDSMTPDERKAWCYHASVSEKCQTVSDCIRRFRVLINSEKNDGGSYMEQLRMDYMDESSMMSSVVTALCGLFWNVMIKKDRKRRSIVMLGS